MSGGLFSYALLAALAIALLTAAFTDLRRRQIDNALNAAIALAAPLWWLAMGFGWDAMGFQIALAAGTFLIACLLFATGQMGGGDVKLLTALALWFTPASFLQLIVLMAVIGGGASIAMAACNMNRLAGETARDALAMATALAWTGGACAILFAAITHRPLIDPATMAVIADVVARGWVTALGFAALLLSIPVLLLIGFRHIMRRQKSRLPIPYGIAIAAAALWVIGERTLPAAHLAAHLAAQTG